MSTTKMRLLSVATVADRLDYTTRTVRRWIADGRIPGVVRTGQGRGTHRIPAAWVDQQIAPKTASGF